MNKKHPLEEVKWGIIPVTVYQGVIVNRLIGGYSVLNTTVKTPEEVDKVIYEAGKKLYNSIVANGNVQNSDDNTKMVVTSTKNI